MPCFEIKLPADHTRGACEFRWKHQLCTATYVTATLCRGRNRVGIFPCEFLTVGIQHLQDSEKEERKLSNFQILQENLLSFCHTDLGANALHWRRLVEENRRFATVDGVGAAAGQDALMVQMLRRAGWKTHRVSGTCLVSHSPNPQVNGPWFCSV